MRSTGPDGMIILIIGGTVRTEMGLVRKRAITGRNQNDSGGIESRFVFEPSTRSYQNDALRRNSINRNQRESEIESKSNSESESERESN